MIKHTHATALRRTQEVIDEAIRTELVRNEMLLEEHGATDAEIKEFLAIRREALNNWARNAMAMAGRFIGDTPPPVTHGTLQ
ncbi:hypothetical protein [Shinella zoogloeoides]|uniref:hypothetical protein n=1 Tax=Shinella zoogloeoides TaxID=352475 RepID=UPI001F594F22|nr:hypothetical protein [Shinella zoogloeoides]